MKILVAGATGAIGKRLVPMLVNAGHTVTGTTRNPDKIAAIRAAGATPEVVDALNADAVLDTVRRTAPDVIIHQLTAIPFRLNLRRFDEDFTLTNRLRTEATDHLLAAARAVGSRRFIAQSYAGWPYERRGSWVKSESDPLELSPEPAFRRAFQAIAHLESAVSGESAVEGFVLRYGAFYGPGTSLGQGGSLLEDVRRRRVPIVGKGTGYWSFIHIDDAAAATLRAVSAGTPGIYNVTDDEPAPVSQWLPFLADAIGAKPPMRIPAWLARMVVGPQGVAMMTQVRGALNDKAKRVLGWRPLWATWRDGFRNGLSDAVAERAPRSDSNHLLGFRA
jgi:nucleoside-diphosphate-sugar epimerase